MKKTKKYNKLTNLPFYDAAVCVPFELSKKTLFLDIETTGLSPKRNRLYLIGAAYLNNTACAAELITEQYFAENAEEEFLLLECLRELFQHFYTIVTFHGNRFDLPFLSGCCKRLGIDDFLSDSPLVDNNKNYVDLYQSAYEYRHILGLENYRQKTIENFLGIERKDLYDGGELIQVYKKYVKQPDDSCLALLLQHNQDDLSGMVQMLALFAYDRFFSGSFSPADLEAASYRKMDGSTGKELIITCQLPVSLPAVITGKNSCYYLHASKDSAVFHIPFLEDTLKYFYPDYRDYYYLPNEDMAVHKSVAAFVDKSHRQRAKASNCYSKKTGAFLPQYEEINTPAFYTDYKAPVSWFEWSDTFTADSHEIKDYCIHILQILKAGK